MYNCQILSSYVQKFYQIEAKLVLPRERASLNLMRKRNTKFLLLSEDINTPEVEDYIEDMDCICMVSMMV